MVDFRKIVYTLKTGEFFIVKTIIGHEDVTMKKIGAIKWHVISTVRKELS